MNLIIDTLKDKKFLKTTAEIAVPVAFQNVLCTLVNMVDTMMISTQGTATVSAVGLANKYFFVLSFLIYGVHTGTGLLMAQFFGNNDPYHIRKSFGLGLSISLCASLMFAILAGFFPEYVMRLFTNSPDSIAAGCVYLKTVCPSYVLFAATSIMTAMLHSIRNVRVPLAATVISILTNVSLNYGLIFGNFGLPCLGVRGAALATVIARAIETAILFWFCFIRSDILRGKITDFFGWTEQFLKSYMDNSVPVILNELIWGLGITLYYVAYGRMGDEAVAAVTISDTVTDLFDTFGNGLYSASAVILGNELGAGHLDTAWDYSKKQLVIALMLGVFCSIVLLLIRDPVLSLFSVSPEVLANAKKCMTAFSVYLPMIYVYGTIVCGVLRSGGDTKMCFVIDTVTNYFIGIPFAFLGSLVWKFPIWITYTLVNFEHFVKLLLCLWRYRQKVWLKNIAKDFSSPELS